jgi:hypothetical protein
MRNYFFALLLVFGAGLFFLIIPTVNRTTAQTEPSSTLNPSFFPLAPCPTCTSPTSTVLNSQAPQEAISQAAGSPQTPCQSDNMTTASDNSNKGRHHRKHKGGISGASNAILQLLIDLLNKLLQMLGGGQINIPSPGTQPEPSASADIPSMAPDTTDPIPEPCPSVEAPISTTVDPIQPAISTAPSQQAQPSQAANPSAVPSQSAGGGTTTTVDVTFYGAYDNDPKGSTDISNPVLHQKAGGVGTFADPLTFASPTGSGEYAIGAKIYVPLVQKYYIREDTCAVSWTAPNGCGAVSHVDLYVGNPSDSQAVVQCEESLTPSGGKASIIVNPPATLTVDPNPIWNQSTGACMKPH